MERGEEESLDGDFEFDLALELKSVVSRRDKLRHLLEFPTDDISVQTEKKPKLYLQKKDFGDESSLYGSFFRIYNNDIFYVRWKYREYGGAPAPPIAVDLTPILDNVDLGFGSGPLDSLQNNDDIIGSYLENAPPDSLKASQRRLVNLFQKVQSRRSKYRASVLDIRCKQKELYYYRDTRPSPSDTEYYYYGRFSRPLYFLFNAVDLTFLRNDLEPVFVSCAIYDQKRLQQITSTFDFELNDPGTLSMIPQALSRNIPEILKSHTCLYSVSSASDDLILLFTFSKVYSPKSYEKAIKHFYKIPQSAKKLKKLQLSITKNVGTNSQYRQVFAFSYFNLFEASDAVSEGDTEKFKLKVGESHHCHLMKIPFNYLEGDITENLLGAIKENKKFKQLPARLTFSISEPEPDALSGCTLLSERFDEINQSVFFRYADKEEQSEKTASEEGKSEGTGEVESVRRLEDAGELFSTSEDSSESESTTRGGEESSGSSSSFQSETEESSSGESEAESSSSSSSSSSSNKQPSGAAKTVQAYSGNFSKYVHLIREFPISPRPYPVTEYKNELYIFPRMLTMGKKVDSVAIMISFHDSDGGSLSPVPACRGRFLTELMPATETTPVSVFSRGKKYFFWDSMRIIIPSYLSERAHILFRIVSTTGELLGYTCFYFKQHDFFCTGMHKLYILPGDEFEESQYLSRYISYSKSQMLLGGSKGSHSAALKVMMKFESSLYPQDKSLLKFYETCATKTLANDSDLEKAARDLDDVQFIALVNSFPPLFRVLTQVISSANPKIQQTLLHVIIGIISRMSDDKYTKTHTLNPFIVYEFSEVETQFFVFEELLSPYVSLLESILSEGNPLERDPLGTRRIVYTVIPITSIIVKSMILRLQEEGELSSEDRWKVFPKDFPEKISQFYSTFFRYLQAISNAQNLVRELNRGLAYFLKDLYSLVDKTFVYSILDSYMKSLSDERISKSLSIILRVELLETLLSSENVIPLNMPLSLIVRSSDSAESIFNTLARKHPLLGHLFRTLRDLLSQEKPTARNLDAVNNLVMSLLYRLSNHPLIKTDEARERVITMFFPYVMSLVFHPNSSPLKKRVDVTEQAVDTAVCTVYILQNMKRSFLVDYWIQLDSENREEFLKLFSDVVRTFEFGRGTKKLVKEQSNARFSSMLKQESQNLILSGELSDSFSSNESKKKKKKRRRASGLAMIKNTIKGNNADFSPDAIPKAEDIIKKAINSKLDLYDGSVESDSMVQSRVISYEATLIILDVAEALLESLVRLPKEERYTSLELIFKVYNEILVRIGSYSVILRALESLSMMITLYRRAIFSKTLKLSILFDLIRSLLQVLVHREGSVRRAAGSLFRLMMVSNYSAYRNINTLELQTLAAVAKAKNRFKKDKEFDYLLEFLATLEESLDSGVPPLYKQGKRMIDSLRDIFTKLLSKKKTAYNAERQSDLIVGIAHAYRHAPHFRVANLLTLVGYYRSNKEVGHAGFAAIQICALISEFLSRDPSASAGVKLSKELYRRISPSVLSESIDFSNASNLNYLKSDSLMSFTNLLRNLKDAVKYFIDAGLYESAKETYRVLIPLLESQGAYDDLEDAHQKLYDISDILEHEKRTKTIRLLGGFYRIRYFGKAFEDDDGREFILKEGPSVNLFALKERIQKNFNRELDNFEILNFGGDVDASTLDPDKNYVQIASVDVYSKERDNLLYRVGEEVDLFESVENRVGLKDPRFYNGYRRIKDSSTFYFDTPITSGNRAQGDIHEQRILRTVLVCEEQMPSYKKRVPVVRREKVVLEPVEVAIRNLVRKRDEYFNEVTKETPDIKPLQSLLQGALLTSVNAGPAEICRVFLGGDLDLDPDHAFTLTCVFKQLVNLIRIALDRNEEHINKQRDGLAQIKDKSERRKAQESIHNAMKLHEALLIGFEAFKGELGKYIEL